jgi:hypothetical protein
MTNGEFMLREEPLESELPDAANHGVALITPQAMRPPELPEGSVE